MKLELKHLAPYLPYKLKVKDTHHEKTLIYDLDDLRANSDYPVRMTCESEKPYGAMLSETLPILRPLSDLSKEIEFEGVRFTPSKDKFWGMNSVQYYMNQFDNWDEPASYLNSRAPYGFVLMLIKWHFDVFGLIDQGLAIDKNTL